MPKKKPELKSKPQKQVDHSNEACNAESGVTEQESPSSNLTLEAGLTSVFNSPETEDMKFRLAEELLNKSVYIKKQESGKVDYHKIYKLHHEAWQEKVVKFLTNTPFTYQAYYESIVALYDTPSLAGLFKDKPNFTLVKLLIGVYYSTLFEENNNIIITVHAIRAIILNKLRAEMDRPLYTQGIILNFAQNIEKSISTYRFPNNEQVVAEEENPLVLLNPEREIKDNREKVIKNVSRGKVMVRIDDKYKERAASYLAVTLNVATMFNLPAENFKGEEIPVNLIKVLFKQLTKWPYFKIDSSNVTYGFLMIFSTFIDIYSKNPGKTLADFEADFKKFISSETLRDELKKFDLAMIVGLGGDTKAIKKYCGPLYKVILEFTISPEKFQKREDELLALKALSYLELINKENQKEKEIKACSKVSINQNKTVSGKFKEEKAASSKALESIEEERSVISKETTSPSFYSDSPMLSLNADSHNEVIDKYLSSVVEKNGILRTLEEYIKDVRNGLQIKGEKSNIIGLLDRNMKVVADFTQQKPVIFIFNKDKMELSDRYLEILTSRKINYTGYGRNGNKIDMDETGDIREVHIKYHNEAGESMTIPSTYKTNITIEGVEAIICYFDINLSPQQWHEALNMQAPQYQVVPEELQSLLSPLAQNQANAAPSFSGREGNTR